TDPDRPGVPRGGRRVIAEHQQDDGYAVAGPDASHVERPDSQLLLPESALDLDDHCDLVGWQSEDQHQVRVVVRRSAVAKLVGRGARWRVRWYARSITQQCPHQPRAPLEHVD